MFEPDGRRYPRSWKEMSFDFKLFFVFHGCMMVLFMFGSVVTVQALIGVVSGLLVVLTGLSIRHRILLKWHWPGVGVKEVLGAIFSIALGLFFLGAVTPRFVPLTPAVFPWFAAGGGIIFFWTLSRLKIIFPTKNEFQSHCGDRGPEMSEPIRPAAEPAWKKTARTAFSLYFLAVWIVGVSFFWKYNTAIRDGTSEATPERQETLREHGRTVYITAEEKKIVSVLQHAMMIGIPSALLLAALLHFVVGVKLFPGPATDTERAKKGGKPANPAA